RCGPAGSGWAGPTTRWCWWPTGPRSTPAPGGCWWPNWPHCTRPRRRAGRGELGELPVQFAEYAARERQELRGPELARLEQFWLTALTGVETSQFPADR